ncbi:MAG: PPOX class F420-dependent oxidoreductase [Pseudomonadota bacterium]
MSFTALKDQAYVSLITIRRSGIEVATPIWMATIDEDFYAFSAAEAGKVKRLRHTSTVRLAACDVRGKLLGEYYAGTAELIDDPDTIALAHQALRSKYGWQIWIADVGAKLTGRFDKRQYLRMRLA